jgi:myo-inositol-1(or 4)-monophosphatase
MMKADARFRASWKEGTVDDPIERRLQEGLDIAAQAAALGLDYFRRRDTLKIEPKGPQDLVSQADRAVESYIRDRLAKAFPEDAIHGEEFGRSAHAGEFTWVIDPIDGTANFVSGSPAWCVVLACIHRGQVVLGITVDPNHDHTYSARRGHGATLNGQPMRVAQAQSISEGSVGVGFCNRITPQTLFRFLVPFIEAGGMHYRNASGALMLAYVAAGQLLAYHEGHMNPWDCLAGLLMIEEAGGVSWPYNTERMFADGDAILAGAPAVVEQLEPWAAFTRDIAPIRR